MTSGRYFQPFQVRQRMYRRRQLESSTLLLHATKYMHFKELSINIVKWHPWFLLKGNKGKAATVLFYCWIQTIVINLVFLILHWNSCQPYFPKSCQYYFLHRQWHRDQIFSIIIIYSTLITFSKLESHPEWWITYSNQEKITLVINWHTPSSLPRQTEQTPATHV